jgi:hypothetical protein
MADSALKQTTAKCNFTSTREYPLQLTRKEIKMEINIQLFRANIYVDSICHMHAGDVRLLFVLKSMFKEKVVISSRKLRLLKLSFLH